MEQIQIGELTTIIRSMAVIADSIAPVVVISACAAMSASDGNDHDRKGMSILLRIVREGADSITQMLVHAANLTELEERLIAQSTNRQATENINAILEMSREDKLLFIVDACCLYYGFDTAKYMEELSADLNGNKSEQEAGGSVRGSSISFSL